MSKRKIGTINNYSIVEGDVNLLKPNEIIISRENEYPILRKIINGKIETFVIIPLKDLNTNGNISR